MEPTTTAAAMDAVTLLVDVSVCHLQPKATGRDRCATNAKTSFMVRVARCAVPSFSRGAALAPNTASV